MKKILCGFILGTILLTTIAEASPENQLRKNLSLSQKYMMANISPSDGLPGSILASPSKDAPNYYFHWVRDAALMTRVVVQNYIRSRDIVEKNLLLQKMQESIAFDRLIQKSDNLSGGLGEPKFMVTGLPFNDPWGRPQYDGPAIRATTSILLAEKLNSEGFKNFMNGELKALIQKDLDFIATHWSLEGYDIWEEVYGLHFYTGMVQYRALRDGVRYFGSLGDSARVKIYGDEALKLNGLLTKYFSTEENLILPTLPDGRPPNTKISHLDFAVLLGFLHGSWIKPDNEFLLNSVEAARSAFAKLYPINKNSTGATLVGRYPEDVYDGIGMGGQEGNAWFITTHALAELHCKLATRFEQLGHVKAQPGLKRFLRPFLSVKLMGLLDKGEVLKNPFVVKNIVTQIRAQGIRYLENTIQHGDKDGHFSEQINRHSGDLQGAHDLSWSYASFITAAESCLNTGIRHK